ncbi:MAG: hypothetical protein WBW71_07385 [Bacteroidota bacterium]
MKYALTVIVSMLLFGCDSTADQAPSNLQKGDEYFAAKQYEVAEYYYDKIPEESPLYKEAQMKMEQIANIEQGELPKISEAEESQKVSVFDQSMTSNAGGTEPVHSVELNNESVHKLTSVVLEFTYFDATGNIVAVKQVKVATPMIGKTQDTFTGITPGSLESPCTSCKVRVVSAEFQ